MKKNIVVLFAVMLCLIGFIDGSTRRYRHCSSPRYRHGGWRRGDRTVIIDRGVGYGSALGGATLGFAGGVMVGNAMINSNNFTRAEIEQLRRDRENDRYHELRREQDKEALRKEFDQREQDLHVETLDDKKKKSKGKRILERQLQQLQEERALKQSQLSAKERELSELDEEEEATPIKKLKKKINKLKHSLASIEAEIDEIESQLALS
jgi:chromosome segregation ATPase